MRRTVSASESWGQEHQRKAWQRPLNSTDEHVTPCPMCGSCQDTSGLEQLYDGKLLWRLAEINHHSPMVLQVLLRRALSMAGQFDAPLEEIAQRVVDARSREATMTRQAVYDQCVAASKQWPMLRPFLNISPLPRRRKV